MNNVQTTRKRLVSRTSPEQLKAARNLTILALMFFGGLFGGAIGWILGPSDAGLVFAAAGATLACTALAGFYAYGKVYVELLGSEDIVEVSTIPDPSATGPSVPVIGSSGRIGSKRLLVGPVRLTVDQWRIIAGASKDNGWKWARKLVWEDSGANVSNVNNQYGKMTRWMLENDFVEDTSGNPSRPTYYVTDTGQDMLRDAASGRKPVVIDGDML